MNTAATWRRKVGRLVLFCIATIALSIGAYNAITKFFSIQVIEVVGNNIQVIVDQQKISKTLLFFPSDRLREEVLRDNPVLADVRFQKKYPHTLVIVPTLRPAFARLHTKDRIVLMDQKGVVLIDGEAGAGALPVFYFDIPVLRVGEAIHNPGLQHALSFTESVKGLMRVDSVTEQDGPYALVKTDKTDIFIPQDKNIGDLLATLQTLMTGFRIKGTLPAVVDLRFDKPVIKF